MAYTLTVNQGVVTRDEDGKQVAPCQSADDPDFIAYQEFVANGGTPKDIYAVDPESGDDVNAN